MAVRALVLVPALIATTVLLGWVLQLDVLTHLATRSVSMNPLTALSFEMSCLAIWLLYQPQSSAWQKLVAQTLASLVLAVGLSKLVDIWLGTSLCPDDVLFHDQLDAGQAYPSRMAPNVALCFTLLALAILSFGRERWPAFLHSQWLALPIIGLSLLALVGYGYDTRGFYKYKQYIPMALHSAFNFALLATAVSLSRPQQGYLRWIPRNSPGARSFARLLPACILVPVLLGGSGVGASGAAVLTAMAMTLLAFLNSVALNRAEHQRELADQILRDTVHELDQANRRLHEEVAERMRLEEIARHQATHDALTGIPNRLLFVDRLEQSIGRAARKDCACALFYVDIDNFKPVNDQYGHQAGDELLKCVAKRMVKTMRAVDTVARLGGDEFAAIMEGPADDSDALVLARRMADAVRAPYSLMLPGRSETITVTVSASVGVALFPVHASDLDQLVSVADRAMYLAKTAGKNQCLLAP